MIKNMIKTIGTAVLQHAVLITVRRAIMVRLASCWHRRLATALLLLGLTPAQVTGMLYGQSMVHNSPAQSKLVTVRTCPHLSDPLHHGHIS